MKKIPFESLITAAGAETSLSTNEKDRMRALLQEYVAFKPVRAEVVATQPYYATVATFFSEIPTRFAFSLVAVLLIIAIASGGVVATSSLPGDKLYSLKVDMLEPAHTSLLFTPEAKSAWHQTLAERRLDEATLLAAEDRLSTTTTETLVTRFEYSASASEKTSDAAKAMATSSREFAARLETYEKKLTEIDTQKERNTTSALRSAIRGHIEKVIGTSATSPIPPGQLKKLGL